MTTTIYKQLGAMEDLAQGVGEISQSRNGTNVQVNKIDVPFSVDSEAKLKALDVTKYTRARVYDNTTEYTQYIYDPTATSGIPPNVGGGYWVIDPSFNNAAKNAISNNSIIKLDNVADMQSTTNSANITLQDNMRVNTGGTTWEVTTVTTTTPLPNSLFAAPITDVHVNDYGASTDVNVAAAIAAAEKIKRVIIDNTPVYGPNIEWKGKEHTTIDLPFKLNSVSIPSGALNARMTISNGYLYNCKYNGNQIQVFNLTDPREPTLANAFAVGSQPRHIDIVGRHAIVCCHGANQLEFYDLSNPTSPGLVGTIPTGANPKMFELAGNELYVVCAGSNTLEKFTYQLPAEGGLEFSYIKIDEVTVSSTPLCCSFNSEGLVAVSGLDTNNVDLVGSSTLNLINSYAVGGPGHGTCVWFNKTQLLVTDSTNAQLHSVNYEEIATPTLSASIDIVPNPEQIEIVGNRCYVPWLSGTGTPSKLSAIDLTDAKSPVEFKQVDLSVAGGGFTAYHQEGNTGYLYVNGHFAPYNLDVIEVVIGQDDSRPINVHENFQARTAGISKLDVGLNSVFQQYRTTLSSITLDESYNIIRSGSSAAITLPDPASMPGKQFTIINVNGAGTAAVNNAFTGFSGTLASFAAVTVVSMGFGGGFQWDAISSHGTIT